MPRHREFAGIAHDLVRSFVSRNNDVDGYWALGVLYLYAKQRNSLDLVISLAPLPNPQTVGLLVETIAGKFAGVLEEMMRRRKMPRPWLAGASLVLEFEVAESKTSASHDNSFARPFRCRAEISDDVGGHHVSTVAGKCWPHTHDLHERRARLRDA